MEYELALVYTHKIIALNLSLLRHFHSADLHRFALYSVHRHTMVTQEGMSAFQFPHKLAQVVGGQDFHLPIVQLIYIHMTRYTSTICRRSRILWKRRKMVSFELFPIK